MVESLTMASLNAVLVDQGQLCLLNQARQLSAHMLESLLHDTLLCMKHSMQVLRLSHLLDDRKPLSFQNKVLSVQHSSVTCADIFLSCKK